jgi:hypothetical protein
MKTVEGTQINKFNQNHFDCTVKQASSSGIQGIAIINTRVAAAESVLAKAQDTNIWDIGKTAALDSKVQERVYANNYSFVNEKGQQVVLKFASTPKVGTEFNRPDTGDKAWVSEIIDKIFSDNDDVFEDLVGDLEEEFEETEEEFEETEEEFESSDDMVGVVFESDGDEAEELFETLVSDFGIVEEEEDGEGDDSKAEELFITAKPNPPEDTNGSAGREGDTDSGSTDEDERESGDSEKEVEAGVEIFNQLVAEAGYEEELERGTKMEADEHGESVPEAIAEDHLEEDPNYYDNLEKMEADSKLDVEASKFLTFNNIMDLAREYPQSVVYAGKRGTVQDTTSRVDHVLVSFDDIDVKAWVPRKAIGSAMPPAGSPENDTYIFEYANRVKEMYPEIADKIDSIALLHLNMSNPSNTDEENYKIDRRFEDAISDLVMKFQDQMETTSYPSPTRSSGLKFAADISDEIPPVSWTKDEPREQPMANPSVLPQKEELKTDLLTDEAPTLHDKSAPDGSNTFQTTVNPHDNSVTVKFVEQDGEEQVAGVEPPGQPQPQAQPGVPPQPQDRNADFDELDTGVSF